MATFMRPARLSDLDALYKLSEKTLFGLTTLPRDREYLGRLIRRSLQGFAADMNLPGGEQYLFALESEGQVVGVSGIVSKIGGFEPFYAYEVQTLTHESRQLNIRKEHRVLQLVREHSGPTEIGSLFLDPGHRGAGAGRLLSLSRFLFMAEFPGRFEGEVIAEMRGVIDDQGRSPFWEALGRHFFGLDFSTADYLSIINKRFIAELMPTFPIYTTLLPAEAQACVGKVHEQTEPALAILKKEGFAYAGLVAVFDAGPVMKAKVAAVRAVRESVKLPARVVPGLEAEPWALARPSLDYRACAGPAKVEFNSAGQATALAIDPASAAALGVAEGEPVRGVRMKAG